MVYSLLQEPYALKIYAPPASKTCCLLYLLQALVVLLPLLLQIESSLFHHVQQYQEQPLLRHQDTLIQASMHSTPAAYSSSPLFLPYIQSPLPALVTSHAMRDTNEDGVPDQFLANVTFKADPTQVSEVHLLFLLDLNTKNTVKMHAKSLVSIQVFSAQGIASAQLRGALALLQKAPLHQNDFVDFTYNSSVLLSPDKTVLPSLSLLAEHSLRRNISLAVHPLTTSIVPATSSQVSSVTVQVVLDIPPLTLMFYPRVSKVLFSLWLKYLALFLPLQALYNYLIPVLFSSEAMLPHHRVQMLPRFPRM